MEQINYKFGLKITIAIIILLLLSLISISYGESNMGLVNSLNSLLGHGDKASVTIVQNIRLPRVLAGILAGATLGLSGLYTRVALKNPLADSSILGIQSGASVMALIALLVFPSMSSLLPLFAFVGGLIAFVLVITFSYKNGFSPMRLVLSGVAINSFFTAITSVITINHINELRNTVQWTSGSLVGISSSEVTVMLGYAIVAILVAALMIPMLELLKLEDNMLISLGKNPNVYRLIASVVAVMLASISLAFVGVIAFVGIIVPHISQMLVGSKMKHIFPMTITCGAILVVGVDLFSRLVFVNEIPVGALIGVLGAPLFLYLLRGQKMVFNVENVSLEIDGKKILSDINADFQQYKFNAIIGPNGCGKSSLIKLFAKINKQSAGKIIFLGEELEKVKRKDFAKKVSFFFQFNDTNSDITVKQMVSYGRSAHKKLYQSLDNHDFEIVDDAIAKCDLVGFENREMNSLSGGEKQRVYLAMTLAQEPEIIVLDEPTNHLDIKYQFQLLSLVRDIMDQKKLTIICILHDFNQVLKYADNTLILKDGQVYASGITSEVITVENVRDVFEIDSIIHHDGNGYHIDFII